MRKELAMAAIGLSLIGASMLPVLPAIAQTASGDQAAANTNGTSADRLLKSASTAVHDMQADSHFADLMSHCKGMFIIPTVVKGGLIVGGKGGQGVLVKKTADGWSQPAFLTLGTVSLGAQAGGAAGQTIMLLMTTKAMHDFIQANNFSLGANAGLTVIGYSAKGQAPVGKGDIVIWSNQSGAFAGTTVSATDITANKQEDHNFYGDTVSTSQIIKGQVPQQPAADQFESTLSSS